MVSSAATEATNGITADNPLRVHSNINTDRTNIALMNITRNLSRS